MSSSTALANLPVRIVLVRTSHPGNIGAVARAMKTMHLSTLRLVKPRLFPHAESTAMASGADDVLANAAICATLEEAVADCGLIFGVSARQRTLRWPQMEPPEAAASTLREARTHPVALVFGHERTGLTNEELSLCHALVNIPSNPEYGSLNLAMAVQVLCYELLMSSRGSSGDDVVEEKSDYATAEEMNYFYTHLEQVMIDSGFLDPAMPKHLMRRLRRLFGRARPDKQEINILRGILASVDQHENKHGNKN